MRLLKVVTLVVVVCELRSRVVFTGKSNVAHGGIALGLFAEGPCSGGSSDM